jgi:hypothetical protein
MPDQGLLTLFIALTAVALLLQTGIIVGLYIVTRKLEKRADQITGEVHRVLNAPANRAIEAMQRLSLSLAEYASVTQDKLRRFEQTLGEKEPAWRERLGPGSKRSA